MIHTQEFIELLKFGIPTFSLKLRVSGNLLFGGALQKIKTQCELAYNVSLEMYMYFMANYLFIKDASHWINVYAII